MQRRIAEGLAGIGIRRFAGEADGFARLGIKEQVVRPGPEPAATRRTTRRVARPTRRFPRPKA